MIYTLTKAAHLVSLFVWIGGMVAVALSLRFPVLSFLKQMRAYDRAVTSRAMIAAWLFGILLAVQGSWFTEAWLGAKILLVLALSGLHGALSGRLRKSTSSNSELEQCETPFLPVGFILLVLIVLLATLKP
ncbi:MAG: CopD family protein [Pseudomonadota bacterium]